MYTVYMHTAPNGKMYVGITGQKPEKRWRNGNGYNKNKYFYRAIQKYGWNNFKHEIICTGLDTAEQAGRVETTFIKGLGLTNPDKGYNHSTGGESGHAGIHPSAETRRKISESLKRTYLNHPELRLKMSEAQKGRHPSAETRLKLIEANKGANNPNYGKHPSDETRRKLSEATKGANNPHYGKHHSLEARKKISEAHKGKHLSAEHKREISEAQKGRIPWNKGKHLSAETRRKIGESGKGRHHLSHEARKKLIEMNKKAVICFETGILYYSVTEAAESIGLTPSAISNVLRGAHKTAGGYHWKYAENMEESK